MAQCHNCGAQVAQGAAACPECGAQFANNQGHRHQQQPQGQPAGRPDGGGVGAAQPAAGAQQYSQTAPAKSKVVTGIFIFYGILGILAGIAFVALADALTAVPGDLAGLGLAGALIFFVLGGIDIALGYGIWNAEEWGWYGGVIISVLSVVWWIITLANEFSFLSLVLLLASVYCVAALALDRTHFGIDF
ncbi:zinc-ribbon domain-containing protein [Salinirussus salinus]|jgi:hypothetical protein|uniref:zinc-ribbon domain-containing protein n=1 Tax=Salinirussus salinus TaxID=1198300 RepID=UPI0013570301|nr:zinc-ribbon domain-containing protein [Salinirussus salinus]